MNNNQFEDVANLSAQKRYEYFIKIIAYNNVIWGLYNNGWAMTEDDEGNSMITFWPEKEFALECAKGIWANYIPESIDLNEFTNDWMPEMEKESIKPAIFYTINDGGIVVEIERILDDLEEELEKIGKEKN